jgi:hypothetical protein
MPAYFNNEAASHQPIRSENDVKQINALSYKVILFHLGHLLQTSYVKT